MARMCCICEHEFTEYPCNPSPFIGVACCQDCDDRFVTPARSLGMEPEIPMLRTLQYFAKLGKRMVTSREKFMKINP